NLDPPWTEGVKRGRTSSSSQAALADEHTRMSSSWPSQLRCGRQLEHGRSDHGWAPWVGRGEEQVRIFQSILPSPMPTIDSSTV
ncbi:hypothetical protein DVA78_18970, partial [Acinetobacter baumannii]